MIKSEPLLEFVCSAYDRPHMLLSALACLRTNIDFPDWTCTVTDNATRASVRRQHSGTVNYFRRNLLDKRYRYLHTGLSDCYASAAVAIKQSRARFIHLMCDDGQLVPYFAQKMVAAAVQNNWDMVACKWIYGPDTFGGDCYVDGGPGPKTFIGKMSFIFRRDMFPGFGLPANGAPILADRELSNWFTKNTNWGVVPERLVVHN